MIKMMMRRNEAIVSTRRGSREIVSARNACFCVCMKGRERERRLEERVKERSGRE